MLFNSIDFAIFLPVVFFVYWFVTFKKLILRNFVLLVASFVFYGWWDWRFLGLIAFSSFVDYFIGSAIYSARSERAKTVFLLVSVGVNLGFLAVFKYFNFFIDNINDAFCLFGKPIQFSGLNIVLPMGISFYTFQTLSYSIDIYRGALKPTKNLVDFMAFVAFFPQLVAGPIERASNLLPQFKSDRVFEYDKAVDGMRQILWGLFKKIVIADNCAVVVNEVYANYSDYSFLVLWITAVLFAFQIYCDFSGYSDIAIGCSRLFGFNLMRNFAYPYFSRDIAEFWRRWHISLSTWFRDYVYIPMGGSRGGLIVKLRNVLVVFILSGFWHGANWTFIAWGALNGLMFMPLFLLKKNRSNMDVVSEGRWLPSLGDLGKMFLTFNIVVLFWVFFRSESLSHAIGYLGCLFNKNPFDLGDVIPFYLYSLIGVFVLLEWVQRDKAHALEFSARTIFYKLRWGTYVVIAVMIMAFTGESQQFIYFQF